MAKPRLILAASVLGSGAVFLEGTITNVAVPAIGRDLHLGLAGLQWVINGYLLPVSALILFGGALGDRFARGKVFALGLTAFAIASLACAAAPSEMALVVARVVQGIAGALVIPNSLAMLETAYTGEARGAAIGQWAAWSAVSTALGPLIGGALVVGLSWRWTFICVAPVAIAAAAAVALGDRSTSHETKAAESKPLDVAGAVLITLGLGGIVAALTAGPQAGFGSANVLGLGAGGVIVLALFFVVEGRARDPLLPLGVFRSRVFSGVNAVTVAVYAALSGLLFLLMLELQNVLGYSALAAGASLLPVNALMLILSPLAGRFAARHGPRFPMTVGAIVAGDGCLLFSRVQPGAGYVDSVLPAAVVFGLGLSCFVAPLTAVALGALDERQAGLASGVNNAAARLAGLLATAIVPLAAGLATIQHPDHDTFAAGFARAAVFCGVLCGLGSLIAFLTMPSEPLSK